MISDQDILGLPELRAVPRGGENDDAAGTGFSPIDDGNSRHGRRLGSNDNYESLLVDSNGNSYEPYSLAWRYLGLYMDCDVEDYNDGSGYYYDNGNYDINRDRNRERELSSNDDGEECQRQLMWAAYVDPRYKGVNGIEEYQFYDLETREWDDSACLASGKKHRCVRMDCHEPNTHFKLVGVFKETDGMYDFTEQLFKHEGYCVWSGDNSNGGGGGSGSGDGDDTYETMEEWMENWPTSCRQLNNPDYYGNTIYYNVQPLPEGNMTLAIYTDEKCTTISPYIDLSGYIVELYSSYYYYYGEDRGTEVAEMYQEAIANWNEKMSTFKVCQPCRAYNLFSEQSNNNQHSNDHRRHRRRFLDGDDNDGEGEETERYNCYDDAGYTNVDQCYKFETHTSLAAADADDLARASAQGSILRVKASDGQVYGKGGYTSPMERSQLVTQVCLAALMAVCLATLVCLVQRYLERRERRAKRELKEKLTGTDAEDLDGTNQDDNAANGQPSLEMPSMSDMPETSSDSASNEDPIQEAKAREMKSITKVLNSLSEVQMRLAKKGKADGESAVDAPKYQPPVKDANEPTADRSPETLPPSRDLMTGKDPEIIANSSDGNVHCLRMPSGKVYYYNSSESASLQNKKPDPPSEGGEMAEEKCADAIATVSSHQPREDEKAETDKVGVPCPKEVPGAASEKLINFIGDVRAKKGELC